MSPDRDLLTEAIRKELAHGCYSMDKEGDAPFFGQANSISAALWEQGYRSDALVRVKSAYYQAQHDHDMVQDEHDKVYGQIEHMDDYQQGVLHGLDKALVVLKAGIDAIVERVTEIAEKGDK